MSLMDFFINLIRLPIALVTSPLLMILFLLILVVEAILALICFPFAAMFMKRNDIKWSWLGSFPNSLYWMTESLRRTWQWAISEETTKISYTSSIEPDDDRKLIE